MHKFVWDTSAIVNIKEPNAIGYSAGFSLWKDLSDGYLCGENNYMNLLPALAYFEVNATVSKLERKNREILREFYLLDENTHLYSIDQELVLRSSELVNLKGFSNLYGADLVFACIAHIENAYLVTMDRKLAEYSRAHIKVIDLNLSKDQPTYRDEFDCH